MRRKPLSALLALWLIVQPSAASQPAAIEALIAELDYLIDRAEALAERYREDTASVRFNYPAFIEQLRVTRNHSAAYLNRVHTQVHRHPPAVVDQALSLER